MEKGGELPFRLLTKSSLFAGTFDSKGFEKPTPLQTELEMVTLDSFVPSDQLFRKIEAVIDLSFLHWWMESGRPQNT